MSHIVVLSSIYLGKASTNGLCAHNIVDALSEEGNEIDVICYEDTEVCNIKNVHTIHNNPQAYKSNIDKLVSKLSKSFYFLLSSPRCYLEENKVDSYYKALCKIDESFKIDAIVAILFPLETAEAMTRFKRSHPETKTIIYELDSISDGVAQSNAIQKFLNFNYYKWLYSMYWVIDNVIIMKSHSDYWLKAFGGRFRNKLKIADIPVLLPRIKKSTNYDEVSFLYAGLIEKKYRSPEYLLQVVSEISKRFPLVFRFYSKGDCEDMIANYAREIPGIQQNGYVTQAELENAIDNTNFLVSIGNSTSNSVPSKLISYISYQKPIIHFSSQKNDVCGDYLARYPLSLVISQDNSIEESANQIISFIEDLKCKEFSNIPIGTMYKMNIPSYSAKLICSIANHNPNG